MLDSFVVSRQPICNADNANPSSRLAGVGRHRRTMSRTSQAEDVNTGLDLLTFTGENCTR